MTAIILPCLLAASEAAIDLSNALSTKTQLGAIADSASLAAASALTDPTVTAAQAKQLAIDFITGQIAGKGLGLTTPKINVNIVTTPGGNSTNSYSVAVNVSGSVKTSLMQVMGVNTQTIGAAATATSASEQQNSLSMYLVLDRSGSMQASVLGAKNPAYTRCTYYWMNAAQTAMYSQSNYNPCLYQRIEVLQNAVISLLATLEKADPTHRLVRTGADAYSSDAFTPQKLDWGESRVSSYVNAMDRDEPGNPVRLADQ